MCCEADPECPCGDDEDDCAYCADLREEVQRLRARIAELEAELLDWKDYAKAKG